MSFHTTNIPTHQWPYSHPCACIQDYRHWFSYSECWWGGGSSQLSLSCFCGLASSAGPQGYGNEQRESTNRCLVFQPSTKISNFIKFSRAAGNIRTKWAWKYKTQKITLVKRNLKGELLLFPSNQWCLCRQKVDQNLFSAL